MSDYRPQVIHYDGEGDPYWQFVERDVPTVTGQVFAANVEMIMDFDGTVIGFNIYDQAPASTDTDTAELVAAFRAYIAACSGAGTTLYDGHPAVLMSKGIERLTALERERDAGRNVYLTLQQSMAFIVGKLTASQAEVERLKEALIYIARGYSGEVGINAEGHSGTHCAEVASAALQPQVGK